MKDKKPIYKKVWFWVVVILVLGIIAPKDKEDKVVVDSAIKENQEASSINEKEETKEEHNVIGKDFTEITKGTPNKVNDDVTGNWRILMVAESFNIEEYAVDYYNRYFEGNGSSEVHAIVNFNNKTTTRITDLGVGNLLEVDIFEYVDKEEHSAKTLFNGQVLKKYHVDKETGKVEEV